jgi:Fic family protein
MSNNKDLLLKIITNYGSTDEKNRYVHWEKLRFLNPPDDLTPELWWVAIKLARNQIYRVLPIKNYELQELKYTIPDNILEELHWLDKNACGTLTAEKPIMNTNLKNTYLISSLIEESITSSQLEGAATTRKVAKKMLQEGRKPRDKSEQMIYNNFFAMKFIKELKNEKLNKRIILELHSILTNDTLENNEDAGRYRTIYDKIYVVDKNGEILFNPPNANEIEKRIDEICKFANKEINETNFIHPIIRSIILHFLFSYTHPFVDGNGRTARALFYWSMAKEGYWLTEFISISKILKNAPAKYAEAFLFTETDENDLTYFIDHQLNVIHRAIEEFRKYFQKKIKDIDKVDKILLVNKDYKNDLNFRQISILRHALKNPGYIYKITEHQLIHGIAYDTARKDLLLLAEKYNFLIKIKDGKVFNFLSPNDLKNRLEKEK